MELWRSVLGLPKAVRMVQALNTRPHGPTYWTPSSISCRQRSALSQIKTTGSSNSCNANIDATTPRQREILAQGGKYTRSAAKRFDDDVPSSTNCAVVRNYNFSSAKECLVDSNRRTSGDQSGNSLTLMVAQSEAKTPPSQALDALKIRLKPLLAPEEHLGQPLPSNNYHSQSR